MRQAVSSITSVPTFSAWLAGRWNRDPGALCRSPMRPALKDGSASPARAS